MNDQQVYLVCFLTYAASVATSIGILLVCRKHYPCNGCGTRREAPDTIKLEEVKQDTKVGSTGSGISPERLAFREAVMLEFWRGSGRVP